MDKVIASNEIKEHDTWNDCPRCGYAWKDDVATPGIIHRTTLCAKCIKMENKSGGNRRR